MNSELSLQERDILVKLLRKLIARPRPADLQGRVLDALVTWQKANDGRPMPMWSLERKTQSKKEELMPILEELAADGRGEFVQIKTKGRPFSGYHLNEISHGPPSVNSRKEA